MLPVAASTKGVEAEQGVVVGVRAWEGQLEHAEEDEEGGEAEVLAEQRAKTSRGTRDDACCDTHYVPGVKMKNL